MVHKPISELVDELRRERDEALQEVARLQADREALLAVVRPLVFSEHCSAKDDEMGAGNAWQDTWAAVAALPAHLKAEVQGE